MAFIGLSGPEVFSLKTISYFVDIFDKLGDDESVILHSNSFLDTLGKYVPDVAYTCRLIRPYCSHWVTKA